MLIQIVIGGVVGFAIGVPVAFLLLKKVRIKSKVRHVQVSLALGFPVAQFVFLLQTSFAVRAVVILATSSLITIALELTLRGIVASAPLASVPTFGMFRTGASVPLDEARSASGYYPYDYFTEDFMTEIHLFSKIRQRQLDFYVQTHGRVPSQKSYLASKDISYHGTHISMTDGIRCTTDTPPLSSVDKNIYLFGGSTMFCIEVTDRLTISSFLQRSFRLVSDSHQVVNCGFPGATAVDRTRMLVETVEIKHGDIVVFYFGDNESGWIDHRSGKLSQQLVPFPIKALRGLADFGSETARWIYGEFAPRSFRKFSRLAAADTIKALNEVHNHCLSKGAHLVAILQPNIYTLRTKSSYEKKLERRFSQDLKTLIIETYKQYEEWVKTVPYGASATHIFNNASSSVFVDWAHANARGSELVAKFIFEEIQKRKLVSD